MTRGGGEAAKVVGASLADFCRRHPGELAGGPIGPTPPGWYGPARAAELVRIHREMLWAGYETDEKRFGRPDFWAVDPAGDCEDKALWCHGRLAGQGWPKSAMRLWLCRARVAGRWRAHAVLVVRLTLEGGMVLDAALDCLKATPTRKADLGYRQWSVVEPVAQH